MDGLTKFSKPTLFVFHGTSVRRTYVQYTVEVQTSAEEEEDFV